MTLQNQVVLITGAARRVGAATARELHAAGARVAVHCRQSRDEADALCIELNRNRAGSAAVLQADLNDVGQCVRLVAESCALWGRLDVLVNNASTFFPTPIGAVNAQQWDDLFASNVRAPFFLAQAAAPHLKSARGCIVNIADIHAERPLKNYPVYSAAKAGLVMLTRSLACELAPEVRVNALAPGAILWPESGLDAATQSKIIDRTFLKRQGTPEEIAKAVLFLVRDATYTTGQILNVDGGRSLNS